MNEVEQQDFTYSTVWSTQSPVYWDHKQTTVITRDLLRNTSHKTVYTYGGLWGDYQPNSDSYLGQIPVESSIDYYGTDGTLLKTETKGWAGPRVMTSDQTTLYNGPNPGPHLVGCCTAVSASHWTVDQNEMMTERDDYDFGSTAPGPILRKTKIANYHGFTGNVTTGDGSIVPQHMVDRPDSVQITDANDNVIAQTSYTYDANGNVITEQKAVDPAGTTLLTTSYKYDGYGNVVSATDPRSNSTTFDYTDSFVDNCSFANPTSAYLTKVTRPSTNGIAHITSYKHRCASGLLDSSVDENEKTTTYTYNSPASDCNHTDGLNRLTEIDSPDGGKTTFCYDDTPGTPSITQSRLMVGSTAITSATKMNGMGQVVRTASAPNTLLETDVDTVYDGEGRVYTVTNPYVGSSSGELSTYTYDALGRAISMQHPDATSQTTNYVGNFVYSTDEAGATWQRMSDGLGRLSSVLEAGNLATRYYYDPQGNLTKVLQTGRPGTTPQGFVYPEQSETRTFGYDALSRLIWSTNWETGTICYGQWSGGNCQGGYDPNGNLLYKTDANGVLTSYSYDALNRLTKKSFTDGSPWEVFGYDGKDESGNPITIPPTTNAIGRLSHSSNSRNSASSFSYDPMGRLTAKADCNVHDCSYSDSQSFGYDLAGNMTSIGYADGRTIQQTFDGAGRLSTVTDVTGGGTGITYFTAQQYTPAGALAQASYGNGVTETNVFNNRLQPCHSYATTLILPSKPNGGNIYDRQSFYNPNPSASSPCGAELNNNGNIFHILDNLNHGWNQDFSYDGLNRLQTAGRADGGYNHTYNYDSFGNMIPQDNLHNNPDLRIDPSTNRLYRYNSNVSIFSYDNAGNLTSTGTSDIGGHTFTYNPLGQVTSVDGGSTATYVYTPTEERASKITSSGWTDYVYLNGQPMSEHGSDGSWTDYIYANGKRIAKASPQRSVIHLSGSNVPNSGSVSSGVGLGGLDGVTLQAGDTLQLWQFTAAENGAAGGVWLGFTNGDYSASWSHGRLYDSDGQEANQDTETGNWHHRSIDLSAWAGLQVNQFFALDERNGAVGQFDLYFSDVALRRADGTVIPVWAGNPAVASLGATVFGPGSATAQVDGNLPGSVDSTTQTTHYYLDDHLGTAQIELSGGGWPLWQGQFTPFGQELDNGLTAMHYKFTGKERDTESGLDYFGARYNSSAMGRFMSPDPINLTEERLLNPSNTLNKYAYAANNPLKYVDDDGKDITIFYERPSLFPPSAGHILMTAENQQTGAAAVMSFGPIREGIGDTERTLAGMSQVSTSEFGLAGATADSLRQQYASLTIQTRPEEAQQVIDWIGQHGGVEALAGGYMLYDQNCTTVCRDALKMVNKIAQGNQDWSPSGFWKTAFSQYAHPYFQNTFGWTGSQPGVNYGQPRGGYDSFRLLELLSKQCTDSWDDKSNTLTSSCH